MNRVQVQCVCVCLCILRTVSSFFNLSTLNVQVCGGMCVFSSATVSTSLGRVCLFTWEGEMEGESSYR